MIEAIEIPRLADLRQRLSENQKESRVLRSLIRVLRHAEDMGNPGRLTPKPARTVETQTAA